MGQFADLKALLEANADKETVRGQAAYLRNQFKFYGIKTPQRRSLTRNLIKAAKRAAKVEWDFLDQCWLAEQREYQYFVCDYLKAMQGQLVYADLKRLELYVQTKQWWDSFRIITQSPANRLINKKLFLIQIVINNFGQQLLLSLFLSAPLVVNRYASQPKVASLGPVQH